MTNQLLHRLLLDNLSTAVVLLNDEMDICFLNSAAETLLETSAQRLLGQPVSLILDSSENTLDSLNSSLQDNHPFTQRLATILLPGHKPVKADLTATPLNSEQRPMLLLEMQPMDRVVRINREEALISIHNTTRNLVSGLAHEIKNPLGGIRGAAQLLSEEIKDQTELLEYTEIITAETNRLCNLVDRLLGPISPLEFKALNIHEILEHIILLTEAETRGSINLARNYDPSIPELNGDREQLIQAMLNIVRNATRALKSQENAAPKIEFVTRIQRHFTIGKIYHRAVCRVDIIDNGPGIPEDITDRIFFPMISGHAEGSGLGLPIAQSLLNLHKGLIECKSRPGKTCFSLYLPLQNGDSE
ncbi:MAG: nitrogen regulation protein NR(II) [Porticoccaceae bacterium]|nr:PAS domain-containing protein [Pseudomonadales bacterium]MCP5173277.1 PAS domain-containing protein [Pseudomonadales bacterium]